MPPLQSTPSFFEFLTIKEETNVKFLPLQNQPQYSFLFLERYCIFLHFEDHFKAYLPTFRMKNYMVILLYLSSRNTIQFPVTEKFQMLKRQKCQILTFKLPQFVTVLVKKTSQIFLHQKTPALRCRVVKFALRLFKQYFQIQEGSLIFPRR